jgi:hypothetical protein
MGEKMFSGDVLSTKYCPENSISPMKLGQLASRTMPY